MFSCTSISLTIVCDHLSLCFVLLVFVACLCLLLLYIPSRFPQYTYANITFYYTGPTTSFEEPDIVVANVLPSYQSAPPSVAFKGVDIPYLSIYLSPLSVAMYSLHYYNIMLPLTSLYTTINGDLCSDWR